MLQSKDDANFNINALGKWGVNKHTRYIWNYKISLGIPSYAEEYNWFLTRMAK